MDWQTYETTVRNIYETLGKNSGVSIECYGNKCKRLGKSDVPHQIDVLTSHSDGIHTYLTAIECKYWNVKVNKDIVMKLKEILADCNFDKGVIVSKIGFTPDAISYAKFSNIALVELREHNLYNLSGKVTKIFSTPEITQAKLYSINLLIEKKHEDGYKSIYPEPDSMNCYIEQPDGVINNIDEIIRKFSNTKVLKEDLFKIVEETTNFPSGSFFQSKISKNPVSIIGLTCKGYVVKHTRLDFDYIENKVWLIMKSIFEKKDYAISENGDVTTIIEPSIELTVGETIIVEYKAIERHCLNKEF